MVSIDDTRTAQQDVLKLHTKYVRQDIDSLRSQSTAQGAGTGGQSARDTGTDSGAMRRAPTTIEVNPNRYIESRTHAFYRMIGFPVVSPNGFYNPGFDPNESLTSDRKASIDESFRSSFSYLKKEIERRETSVETRRNIFAKADEVSIFYSNAQRFIKPFLVADPTIDSLSIDRQTVSIEDRDDYRKSIDFGDTAPPKLTYSEVQHCLKPFIVSPDIELSVTPGERRICVPFLRNVAETKITSKQSLKRPIIELIIIARLAEKTTVGIETDSTFIDSAKSILNIDDTSLQSETIRNVLLALSGKDTIAAVNDDIVDTIKGFTSIQTNVIIDLTKVIKSIILKLNNAIKEFDNVQSKTYIKPLASTEGPEFPELGAKIAVSAYGANAASNDQKIAMLQLLQSIADERDLELSQSIGNITDIFSNPQAAYAADAGLSGNVKRDFSAEINKLKKERDSLSNTALQALKTIEIITGEISGLGLIDIFAIYTALWAIDMKDLLGFLDTNAINRLITNFPNLVTSEVNEVKANPPKIQDVLNSFESILFNILAFADNLLKEQGETPLRSRGGSIV